MKKLLIGLILIFNFANIFANCDLSRFRWECDIPLRPRATAEARSLVYCGNSYGYVSNFEYNIIMRYQRVNVNMVLKINGEYVDSPCIAAHRY